MIGFAPFHAPEAAAVAHGSGPVGNPMYDVLPGHEAAILAVLALPLVAWWLRLRAADGDPRSMQLVGGYDALASVDRLAVWAMAASAVVHLVLAPGHAGPGVASLFVIEAGLLTLAIHRALHGRPWRLLGGLVLAGSIVAYPIALLGGDVPDQVGLATKLVELTGLAAITRGSTRTRRATRLVTGGSLVGLALLVAIGGWSGAVAAAGGGTTGHGHAPGDGHTAAYPPPGSVMPGGIPAEATDDAEVAAARDLHDALVVATARYADPAIAARDGYDVEGIFGTDFHAANAAYEADGRILDPGRPENLIYAATPTGPVLLGAMFTVPPREAGPMIGGPLTVWHAHEHVCLGLIPPGLSGLLSPLGGCPLGSIDVPATNEMIHAWVIRGAPQAWGDLDEAWRAAYLARFDTASATD